MAKRIKFSYVFYLTIALITAVLVISFTVWAAKGAAIEQVNVIEGEVLLEDVRNEYLVGQDIDSTGVSLKVGDKTYSSEELEFAVDNQSAGSKAVEVYRRDGNDYYRGYYLVTYFAIRHLDMHKAPTSVKFDSDGNVSVEGMELWAELSGKPTSFVQPDDPNLDSVIILDKDNYTLEVDAQDENGGYLAKIICGKLSVNIYFIDVNGEMVILESANRVATFTNENGTNETLALYITSRGGSSEGKINVAVGFFIYRDANGVAHKLQFDYFMSSVDWSSNFHSDDIATLYRRGEADDLVVQIGNLIFSTSRSSWCLAILDNPNP
ncbi:MAG: hypothetical protein J1G02_04600 [Clostridiales bacterium]|nr:hypothetical protein [Clostridiales bacterium]